MGDQEDLPRSMPDLVASKPTVIAGSEGSSLPSHKQTIKTAFEYFSTHVVAISVAATVFVAATATAMMFGYMAVLDIHLIAIAQHSDVFSFAFQAMLVILAALIVVAVYALFAASAWVQTQAIKMTQETLRRNLGSLKISVFVFSFFAVWQSLDPLISDPLILVSSRNIILFYATVYTPMGFGLLAAMFLTGTIALLIRSGEWKWSTLALVLLSLACVFFGLGSASARIRLYARETYNVTTKLDHFENVILALTLGRGVVLYKRELGDIVIIPEAEIMEIVVNRLKP